MNASSGPSSPIHDPTQASAPHLADLGKGRTAVAVAVALTAMAVSTVYMTQPLFGLLAQRFAISATQARLAFGWPLFTYAVVFFLVGPMSDRLRASHLACGGGLLLSVVLGLAWQIDDFSAFVAVMSLAGAAAACVPAATFALMARVAPPGRLGFYFGLGIAASVAGITLGRTLGGILAARLGLPGMFLSISAAVAVLAVALLAIRAPDQPTGRALSVGQTYGDALRLIAAPGVARLLGIGALLFFGYLGLLTFFTYRLQAPPFGFSSASIGWISLVGLVAIVGAPASGIAIGRWAARPIAMVSIGVVLAGLAALGLATNIVLAVTGLLGLFLGVFSCQPAILVLLSLRVSPTSRGAISSLYLLVCLVGGSISSLVFGPIWEAFGWTGITLASSASVLAAFLLTTGTSR